MIKYKVEFSETSLGHLKKLDKSVQTIILKWIKKNLVDWGIARKTDNDFFLFTNRCIA